jgi:hypothetical protein
MITLAKVKDFKRTLPLITLAKVKDFKRTLPHDYSGQGKGF